MFELTAGHVFWFLLGFLAGLAAWANRYRAKRLLPKPRDEDLFWDRR